MACPGCKCRETYPYYEEDWDSDTDMERCAHCGHIFFIELAADDDDEMEYLDIPQFLRRGND